MSNVFNKELQQAIKEVYTELEAKELIQGNEAKANKLGVYFAHGATEKAEDKLETDQDKSNKTGQELKEATNATEVCGNIVTAATAAASDARNTNSYASTAAVNIQAAANSLTDLSADVAAIFAVATSKDYGDKIQHLAHMAYKMTQTAAEKAENTTLQSLNTTIEAAQSRAAVSLSQSKTLKTSITSLTKTLDQNFEALQAKITTDSSSLAAAIATENEKEGVYQTSLEEELAMEASEVFINKHVNYDLRYIPISNRGEQFFIAFNAFDEYKLMLENGKIESKRAIKEYRIIFTSVDDAQGFDIHAAKATQEGNYLSVKPKTFLDLNKPVSYKKRFVTAEYISALENNSDKEKVTTEFLMKYNKAVDYQGKAVKRGLPYVAFVYVEYSCDYQNEMDNTDGFLSLPSLPFTLLTDLPRARKPKLHFYNYKSETSSSCNTSNAVRVSFNVGHYMFHDVDLTDIMDFRVILFNQNNELASKLNKIIKKELNILFQFDEEYRLKEQAYLEAEEAYNTAVATGIGDVKKMKKERDDAKTNYENKTKAYNNQQDKIDELNKAKISNFILDEDILASIPDAFGMDAKIVTPELIEGLKNELELYNAENTALDNELKELAADQKNKKSALSKVNDSITSIEKNLKKEEKDLDDLKNQMMKDQKEEEVLETLIEIFEKDLPEDTIELIDALMLDDLVIKKIKEDAQTIFKIKENIANSQQSLEDKQEEAISIKTYLEFLSDQTKKLTDKKTGVEYQVVTLTEELKELDTNSSGVSDKVKEDLKAMEATAKELEKTIEKMKKSGATKKDIQELIKELSELEKEYEQLKKDASKNGTITEAKHFVAINKNGDFTDNYGEPMIHGETYTALVYSIIKPTEPDALPLFQPVYSSFADGAEFTLKQL